jgi:hypothetical protein
MRQSPRAKESLLLRSQKESTHIYSTVGQGLEMREYLARLQQNMLSFNRTRMVSSIRVIAMSTAIQSGEVSKSLVMPAENVLLCVPRLPHLPHLPFVCKTTNSPTVCCGA